MIAPKGWRRCFARSGSRRELPRPKVPELSHPGLQVGCLQEFTIHVYKGLSQSWLGQLCASASCHPELPFWLLFQLRVQVHGRLEAAMQAHLQTTDQHVLVLKPSVRVPHQPHDLHNMVAMQGFTHTLRQAAPNVCEAWVLYLRHVPRTNASDCSKRVKACLLQPGCTCNGSSGGQTSPKRLPCEVRACEGNSSNLHPQPLLSPSLLLLPNARPPLWFGVRSRQCKWRANGRILTRIQS